jgi:hypothetical protein
MQHTQRWRWLLLVLLLIAVPVLAQTSGSYDLDWWTVDAGNEELTAGTYTLRGAAGQPDVHTSRTESYTLRGGFVQPDGAIIPTTSPTPDLDAPTPTASPTATIIPEPESERQVYLPLVRR